MKKIFNWTYIAPTIAWIIYLSAPIGSSDFVNMLAIVALIIGVLSAVHHAEVVAHRVGEPYGSFILAVAVTLLEASIIVSLMLTGGVGAETYARDTIFAAVMLILNGILGISMLLGAIKFKEQVFEAKSVTIALVSLVSILVLSLVLPNFTTSICHSSFGQFDNVHLHHHFCITQVALPICLTFEKTDKHTFCIFKARIVSMSIVSQTIAIDGGRSNSYERA